MSKEFSIQNLPKEWVSTTLSEVSLNITDGSHNPPKRQEKGVPMLSAQNVNNSTIDFERARLILEEDFIFENERTNIQSGDVLITTVATIGRVAIVPENLKQQFALQRSVSVVKPLINGKYLMYYCQSPVFQELLSKNATGTAQKGIYLNTLRSLPIPVSPESEQKRIVFTLEELFSELDHSIESLKLAQKQLNVFRQALLKQAFEGKLTEEWRKENSPAPAEKIFKLIKEERQARYEQEIKDWKEAVKNWENKGKKDKKPKKPKQTRTLFELKEEEKITQLPSDWKWIKIGDFEEFIGSGSTPKGGRHIYLDKGIPFVRSMNVYPNKLLLDGLAFIDEITHAKMERSQLKEKDVLLNITGASIGRCANVPHGFGEANVNQHVCIIRPFTNIIQNEYLCHYLNSPNAQQIIQVLNSGATREAITLEQIRNFPFPLTSSEEQKTIVSELESKFSIIDNLDQTIEIGIQKSITLRQSILKKAFQGKLVEQDLNDEHASVLLGRIKKEKEAFLKAQKERKLLDKPLTKRRRSMAKELKHIIDILKESKEPILANRLWEESIYKDDIDAFYAKLKTHIETGEIIELPREGKKSYLKLADSK